MLKITSKIALLDSLGSSTVSGDKAEMISNNLTLKLFEIFIFHIIFIGYIFDIIKFFLLLKAV